MNAPNSSTTYLCTIYISKETKHNFYFCIEELNIKKYVNNGGGDVELILCDVSLMNVFNISTAYFHRHTWVSIKKVTDLSIKGRKQCNIFSKKFNQHSPIYFQYLLKEGSNELLFMARPTWSVHLPERAKTGFQKNNCIVGEPVALNRFDLQKFFSRLYRSFQHE
jgi:hypothetical protein